MPLPAFVIPAAGALISGIANIFSGNAAAAAEKKRIAASNAILERSIIDDAELAKMLRGQSRMFSAQLQNTINTTAIRSGGIANKGVVGAAAAGQVLAAESQTLAQTEQDVSQRNSQIRARQAMITASGTAVSDPVGDFVSGAVSGGIAGAQFNRTLGLMDELGNDPVSPTSMMGSGAGVRGTNYQSIGSNISVEPEFLKKFKPQGQGLAPQY
jgi:hypothetical protein